MPKPTKFQVLYNKKVEPNGRGYDTFGLSTDWNPEEATVEEAFAWTIKKVLTQAEIMEKAKIEALRVMRHEHE